MKNRCLSPYLYKIIAKVKIWNKVSFLKENILLKKLFTCPSTFFNNINGIFLVLFWLCGWWLVVGWLFGCLVCVSWFMLSISKELITILSAKSTISTTTTREIFKQIRNRFGIDCPIWNSGLTIQIQSVMFRIQTTNMYKQSTL